MSPALAVAAAIVVLALVGALLGLGALRRQEARQARLLSVLAPHRPAVAPARPRPSLFASLREGPVLARLAALFGLRLDRAADIPVRWWLVLLIAFFIARALAGVMAILAGEGALLATPFLWIGLCRFAFGWMDGRRRQILFRQFPDALGMVVRAVRVGIPVTEAIRNVAREGPPETAAEFRRIGDRLAIGLPLDLALAETAHRNGVPEYRFFATTLALQNQTGGALGEALENLAEVIRKRVALRERGYALASEARTSAVVLTLLPFLTVGLLSVINPAYVRVLFEEREGQQVLAVAIGMLLLGIGSMRIMIRRSLG